MITFHRDILKDKIHACWIGKNIGGTMGTPFEGRQQINDISGFSTPANVVLPNDDLDLQLVWLRAAEETGPYHLNAQVLGEHWLNYIPPHWNEYGIGKNNLRAGLLPPLSGEYHNDWKNSNGAWIRTEVWACMAPGAPDVAMHYAMEDACVDHGMGEGTYAAMFVAAIESAAFVIHDIHKLIEIGLSKIPQECRMTRSIRLLLDCYKKGLDWKTARNKLVEDSADLGWFEAPANVSFAMLGMLYGEGDFKKSMILAIDCGDDTDCTGATLGSLFGILNGTQGIPKDWSAHIGDKIETIAIDRGSCYGLPGSCTELTERVFNMIPVMLHANHVGNIQIGSDAESADEGDVQAFFGGQYAKNLAMTPANSYLIDFIWGDARVIFENEPVIMPHGQIKVSILFRNKMPDPKHLHLRWILPEGFSTDGGRKDLYLPHYTSHSTGEAVFTCTIYAGEKTEAVNRIILEAVCPARPTVGYIPVTLLG